MQVIIRIDMKNQVVTIIELQGMIEVKGLVY